MLLRIIARTFLWLWGWKTNQNTPEGYERSVMLAVPHTSNWDIVFARSAFAILGVPVKFTIKKEWLAPPFGWLLRPLGAIGIDRSPKKPGEPRPSMVEAMATLFAEHTGPLVILVTPEGTRSYTKQWRTGFYYVAKQAGVPVTLGYLDYKKKEAGVGAIIHLTDDMEADMRKIMAFYREKAPKYTEKFALDERYS